MLYRREDTTEYIWGLISKNSHFTGLVFPVNIIFRFEKCCTSCKRNCIRAVFKTTKERWKRQIALIQVWRALLVIFRNWVPKKRSACDWVLKRSFVKCLLRAADPIPPESPGNVPDLLSLHRLELLQSSQSSLCFCSRSRAANSGKGGLREPFWGECWACSTWHRIPWAATTEAPSKAGLAETRGHTIHAKAWGKRRQICGNGHSPPLDWKGKVFHSAAVCVLSQLQGLCHERCLLWSAPTKWEL